MERTFVVIAGEQSKKFEGLITYIAEKEKEVAALELDYRNALLKLSYLDALRKLSYFDAVLKLGYLDALLKFGYFDALLKICYLDVLLKLGYSDVLLYNTAKTARISIKLSVAWSELEAAQEELNHLINGLTA